MAIVDKGGLMKALRAGPGFDSGINLDMGRRGRIVFALDASRVDLDRLRETLASHISPGPEKKDATVLEVGEDNARVREWLQPPEMAQTRSLVGE